jgi:hypothetical protein
MSRTRGVARGLLAVACVAVVLEVAFFLFVGLLKREGIGHAGAGPGDSGQGRDSRETDVGA